MSMCPGHKLSDFVPDLFQLRIQLIGQVVILKVSWIFLLADPDLIHLKIIDFLSWPDGQIKKMFLVDVTIG